MLCKSFSDLTPLEQSTLIGQICHCIMNDEGYYLEGKKMVSRAMKKQLFKGITINPGNLAPVIPEHQKTETP